MTDSEIIELFNERDERAISLTQSTYGKYCEKIARNILGDESEVGECVNDALLKAWESIPPERPQSLRAYLAAITRNNAISRYRRGATKMRANDSTALVLEDFAEMLPASADVEKTAEHRAILEEINRFLGGLPSVNRVVFVLRYYCFESVPDIAARLGMSKRAVSAALYRTKKQIRKHLEKEGYFL